MPLQAARDAARLRPWSNRRLRGVRADGVAKARARANRRRKEAASASGASCCCRARTELGWQLCAQQGLASAWLCLCAGVWSAIPRNRANQRRVDGKLGTMPEREAVAYDLDAPAVVDRHIEVHGRQSNVTTNAAPARRKLVRHVSPHPAGPCSPHEEIRSIFHDDTRLTVASHGHAMRITRAISLLLHVAAVELYMYKLSKCSIVASGFHLFLRRVAVQRCMRHSPWPPVRLLLLISATATLGVGTGSTAACTNLGQHGEASSTWISVVSSGGGAFVEGVCTFRASADQQTLSQAAQAVADSTAAAPVCSRDRSKHCLINFRHLL